MSAPTHSLVVSPFLGEHLVLRPGNDDGVQIPLTRYLELSKAASTGTEAPRWLVDGARQAWGLDLPGHRPLRDTVIVRAPSTYGMARASWEINKGCDYDCPHCYLGLKRFEGMPGPDKIRLLDIMRDAGVLWLQITGGEPLIDREFPEMYSYAYDLGIMLTISTNGSQLHKPKILDTLAARPPHHLSLSVYGATEETYDGFTRNRGAFGRFIKGLDAAREAGLRLQLNIVVTNDNADEFAAMEELAERYGQVYVFTNMSPTIQGDATPIPEQARKYLRKRKPFTGCNAGHTFFHADPFGHASICKIGREPHIALMQEGIEGLKRLGGIADGLQLRTGGCAGCTFGQKDADGNPGGCTTCRPMARLYQEAKAPREMYCQHPDPEPVR
ncbi:radical SAM protein [Streptomyces sp. HNM0663]|uniref:Radical SAM protein n=1 Tax=Streptomyces chengmaiensis TaxID=3040919 RepID=A0ABT6HHC7_9ACTN|nr:radical SAM protein [Streptomyces chengmaiensis]MDH2387648.1 radical SAM protein [Streptomyces chengmaiensis]